MRLNMFGYEEQNDPFFENLYRFAWVLLVILGGIGIFLFFLQGDTQLALDALEIISENIIEIGQLLGVLAIAALVVGWIQVALASKLGEELILLVTWVTPFLVIGVSAFLYLETDDVNLLGGAAAGLLFLGFILYFRKSIRLSARLVEVGAEITTVHPSLFIPQLTAFLATVVVTILMIPGTFFVASITYNIHPILTWVAVAFFCAGYYYVIAAFQAFADASNISFIDYWYSKKSDPDLGKAADDVKNRKSAVVKYAFLMAFLNRFRSNRRNGFTPGKLFQFMNFKNWPKLLMKGRSALSTAADVAAYFGAYTLIVMMVEGMNSVAEAYKASAKTTFNRFVENIAGSMGFNILENFRTFVSGLLMLLAGGIYGYTTYDNIITAIIMALLFLFVGYRPLDSMFKPAVNAYRVILYRSHTGKISQKLDDKTRQIIKEVIK